MLKINDHNRGTKNIKQNRINKQVYVVFTNNIVLAISMDTKKLNNLLLKTIIEYKIETSLGLENLQV